MSKDSKMDPGAIAGIVIGSTAFVAFCILITIWRQSKNRPQTLQTDKQGRGEYHYFGQEPSFVQNEDH